MIFDILAIMNIAMLQYIRKKHYCKKAEYISYIHIVLILFPLEDTPLESVKSIKFGRTFKMSYFISFDIIYSTLGTCVT